MTEEPELPLLSPLIPLEWLPDETLFSLCSRHHRLSGNRLPATTCRTLFGHPRQGCAHDFPSRIDSFALATRGCLGSAEQIVYDRTLLPYFLPFAQPEIGRAAIDAMRGPSIGGLKFRLGLLTSGIRAHHPLKGCLDCIEDDLRSYASAYWHRSHQLPGAAVCLKHKTWLCASNRKASGVGRFEWLLPHASHLIPISKGPVPVPALKLAQAAIALSSAAPGQTSAPDHTRQCYRQALREKGLMVGAEPYRLRHKEAGAEFAEFRRALTVAISGGPPPSINEAAAEVARLIYKPRSGTHPLKHLLLITWLFPSFEEFSAQCRTDRRVPVGQPQRPDECAEPARGAQKRVFFALLGSGLAVSTASGRVGVDAATGMAWAAAQGIATPRRPKILKPEVHARMVKALMGGAGKDDAASIGGVSVSTVTKVLRTEVGLRQAWRSAQFNTARDHHRSCWLNALDANPQSGVKVARLLEAASYAWLYRNDRTWLTENTRPTALIASSQRIDWDARDADLASAVRIAALDILNQSRTRAVRLWQLYQQVPELKAKLAQLDRLPLTRAAVFQAATSSVSHKPDSLSYSQGMGSDFPRAPDDSITTLLP